MKTAILLFMLFYANLLLGQKVILLNKSTFDGSVDSIRVYFGNNIHLKKLENRDQLFVIQNDTLIVEPIGYIPLQICGLTNIIKDTISIKNYQLRKYCSNDTITYSRETRRLFSSEYRERKKIKIISCQSSERSYLGNFIININDLDFMTSLQERTSYEIQRACSKRHSYSVMRVYSEASYKVEIKKGSH